MSEWSIGDAYMNHAGYRPPPAEQPKSVPVSRLKRCPSVHPQFDTVQCIHLASTAHKGHSGWHDEVRLEWSDAPMGPRTRDELDAAAWELTSALGIKVTYDPAYNQLVLDHLSVGEWWDREDRRSLVESWRTRDARR